MVGLWFSTAQMWKCRGSAQKKVGSPSPARGRLAAGEAALVSTHYTPSTSILFKYAHIRISTYYKCLYIYMLLCILSIYICIHASKLPVQCTSHAGSDHSPMSPRSLDQSWGMHWMGSAETMFVPYYLD